MSRIEKPAVRITDYALRKGMLNLEELQIETLQKLKLISEELLQMTLE